MGRKRSTFVNIHFILFSFSLCVYTCIMFIQKLYMYIDLLCYEMRPTEEKSTLSYLP